MWGEILGKITFFFLFLCDYKNGIKMFEFTLKKETMTGFPKYLYTYVIQDNAEQWPSLGTPHRTPKWLRSEGTSGGHLVWFLCSRRNT